MVTFVQKIAPTFQRRPYTYEPYYSYRTVFVEGWNIIIDFAPKVLNISFQKTSNIFTIHNIYKFLIGTFMCKIAPTVPKTPLYLSLRPFPPLLYAHTHTHPFLWRCWNIIIDFAPNYWFCPKRTKYFFLKKQIIFLPIIIFINF